MTFNTIGYIIFGIIIYFMTIHVGWSFFKNGRIYLERVFTKDQHLVDSVNKILLVGYYLLNLGAASLSIIFWPKLSSLPEMLECIANRSGLIILGLGIMHHINMFGFFIYSYFKNKTTQISN